MPKIFCIGFQKTGTTSLGQAFSQLGYKVCGVYHELLPALNASQFEAIKPVVDTCEVVKDNPWPVLYRQLDQYYPGSKFILTIREETAWIKSVVNHFNETPSAMIEYIYGVPYPKSHETLFLKRYRQHNEEVIAYFKNRSEDLLILDVEHDDVWEKLNAFLKIPTPSFAFPHKNKGAYTLLGKWRNFLWKRIRGRWRRFRNFNSR